MGGKDEQHIDPQSKSRKHHEDTKQTLKQTLGDSLDHNVADMIAGAQQTFDDLTAEKMKEKNDWKERNDWKAAEKWLMKDQERAAECEWRKQIDEAAKKDQENPTSFLVAENELLGDVATSVSGTISTGVEKIKEVMGVQEPPPPPSSAEKMKEKVADAVDATVEKVGELGDRLKEAVGVQEPAPKKQPRGHPGEDVSSVKDTGNK